MYRALCVFATYILSELILTHLEPTAFDVLYALKLRLDDIGFTGDLLPKSEDVGADKSGIHLKGIVMDQDCTAFRLRFYKDYALRACVLLERIV
jgi:hypothetical protein